MVTSGWWLSKNIIGGAGDSGDRTRRDGRLEVGELDETATSKATEFLELLIQTDHNKFTTSYQPDIIV